VLLNFNVGMVPRFGGRLKPTSDTDSVAAAKTTERMDRFLGGNWWRECFMSVRDDSDAASAAATVVEQYCGRVRQDTGYESFPVPIRRRPHHQPLFRLVLFYRHPSAPWKFNEAVSHANWAWRLACRDEELRELRAERENEQEGLWSVDEELAMVASSIQADLQKMQERDRAEWINEITENLRPLLLRQGEVRLGVSTQEVYGSTIGLARDLHVNAAWRILAEQGVAEPKTAGVKHLHNAVITRRRSPG
jgi:hypothetical protein